MRSLTLIVFVVCLCFLPDLTKSQDEFVDVTILNWNILCPIYVDKDFYKNSNRFDLNLLNSETRLQLAINYILETDADIVTLQEVQNDTYKVIEMALRKRYRPVAFAHHTPPYWKRYVKEGLQYVPNGEATFYKKNKFSLVSHRSIQTTTDGNVCLMSVLQPIKSSFLSYIPFVGRWVRGNPIIILNSHLESGATEEIMKTRVSQAFLLHKEIETTKQKLLLDYPRAEAPVIWLGDFNTFSQFPGMMTVRTLGYVDVMEHLNRTTPTFYNLYPDLPSSRGIRFADIDHVVVQKTQLNSKAISIIHGMVPDIFTPEFEEKAHIEKLIDILKLQLRRKYVYSLHDVITNVLDSEIFSGLYGSYKDNTQKYDGPVNREMRLGSDHLPLHATLRIKV